MCGDNAGVSQYMAFWNTVQSSSYSLTVCALISFHVREGGNCGNIQILLYFCKEHLYESKSSFWGEGFNAATYNNNCISATYQTQLTAMTHQCTITIT